MAKLGLVFIAVFCIVQISLAARLPREAEVETTTVDFLASLQEKVTGALNEGINVAKQTFTKENADKFIQTVQQTAEEAGKNVQQWGNDAKQKFGELAESAQKTWEKKD